MKLAKAANKAYFAFLALAAVESALVPHASAAERHGLSSSPSQISGLPGGSGDSAVPISVENGEIIVNVTIDGKGPFPMIFDTGSVGAVTPETAGMLGSRAATRRAAVERLASPLHSLASRKCGLAAQNC